MFAINVQIPNLMVALLFCADSITAVFKWSLDPDPAFLGTTLCSEQKKTPTYIFNYNSGISWSIFIIFVPVEREINTLQCTYLQSWW